MADGKHARQLRAALSYRHKVKRLGRENDEARSDGRIDEDRHATLRSFYNAHGLRAEAAIAKVRNLLDLERSQLRARNAAYEQERDALSVRAAAGEVQASAVRQRHRKLTQDIERIRVRLEQLETLLAAREPMSLGGFIDMPLDEYDVEPPPAPSRAGMALRWGTVVVALATGCTVFLPWFGADGGQWSLPAFPSFLAAEFPGTALSLIMRNSWIIAFALPLVACPFAAMARPRSGGQGAAIVGAAAVMNVILCTLLGAFVFAGASGAVTIIGYLEPAYFGYLFGALGLTFLGTARMGIPATGRIGVRQIAPAAICIALAIFLSAAGVTVGSSGGRLLAQVDSTDVDRGIVRIFFGREGHSADVVHVPWPSNDSAAFDERTMRSHFGVNVYLRRSGEGEYRYLADSAPFWEVAAQMAEGNALSVEPGTRTQAAFDLRRMRSAGIDAEALRFDITSGRGDMFESVIVELPSDFRAEPQAVATAPEPAPAPTPTAPDPQPEPESFVPEPAPEPVAEPAPPAETYVRFTGLYGGGGQSSAVFSVTDANGEARVTVEPGQTIVGAWYLDRIESRPSRAVIRRRGTNEEIEIHRREYATISEDDL